MFSPTPTFQAWEMLETCQPGGDNPEITLAANPIKFTESPTTLYQFQAGDIGIDKFFDLSGG